MRLLNTKTGEFKWVDNPEDIRYAILSHTWSAAGEQTYADIIAIQDQVHAERDRLRGTLGGVLPDNEVPLRAADKIRRACAYALSEGFEHIWIDSGCIDKTNSVELSEAINSMYRWYSHAAVCYAYLADVPGASDPDSPNSHFRRSRWFTRGWTLQELIAPRALLFLSREWEMIGGKDGLSGVIEEMTGIDAKTLLHERALGESSVARRMSWAARRVTTRKEDEAYSLMGIFGIHMSTIYGEGRLAFVRLQEEILKEIPDQSIFAWENSRGAWVTDFEHYEGEHPRTLFAASPADFANSGDVKMLSKTFFYTKFLPNRIRMASPSYLITAYGLRAVFPILTITHNIKLALLACANEKDRVIALVLRWDPRADAYVVGEPLLRHTDAMWYRGKVLGDNPRGPPPWQRFWRDLTSKFPASSRGGHARVVCLSPEPVWALLRGPKSSGFQHQANLLAEVELAEVCIAHRPRFMSLIRGGYSGLRNVGAALAGGVDPSFKITVPSRCRSQLKSSGYSLFLTHNSSSQDPSSESLPPTTPFLPMASYPTPSYTVRVVADRDVQDTPEVAIHVYPYTCDCGTEDSNAWFISVQVVSSAGTIFDIPTTSGSHSPPRTSRCREADSHVQSWDATFSGTSSLSLKQRWRVFFLSHPGTVTDSDTPADSLKVTPLRLTFVRECGGNKMYQDVYSLFVEVLPEETQLRSELQGVYRA